MAVSLYSHYLANDLLSARDIVLHVAESVPPSERFEALTGLEKACHTNTLRHNEVKRMASIFKYQVIHHGRQRGILLLGLPTPLLGKIVDVLGLYDIDALDRTCKTLRARMPDILAFNTQRFSDIVNRAMSRSEACLSNFSRRLLNVPYGVIEICKEGQNIHQVIEALRGRFLAIECRVPVNVEALEEFDGRATCRSAFGTLRDTSGFKGTVLPSVEALRIDLLYSRNLLYLRTFLTRHTHLKQLSLDLPTLEDTRDLLQVVAELQNIVSLKIKGPANITIEQGQDGEQRPLFSSRLQEFELDGWVVSDALLQQLLTTSRTLQKLTLCTKQRFLFPQQADNQTTYAITSVELTIQPTTNRQNLTQFLQRCHNLQFCRLKIDTTDPDFSEITLPASVEDLRLHVAGNCQVRGMRDLLTLCAHTLKRLQIESTYTACFSHDPFPVGFTLASLEYINGICSTNAKQLVSICPKLQEVELRHLEERPDRCMRALQKCKHLFSVALEHAQKARYIVDFHLPASLRYITFRGFHQPTLQQYLGKAPFPRLLYQGKLIPNPRPNIAWSKKAAILLENNTA